MGPASLADKWVISNEMGAILSQAYCTSLSTLLSSVNPQPLAESSSISFTDRLHRRLYGLQLSVLRTVFGGATILGSRLRGRTRLYRTAAIHPSTRRPRADVAIYNKVSMIEVTFSSPYSADDLRKHGKFM